MNLFPKGLSERITALLLKKDQAVMEMVYDRVRAVIEKKDVLEAECGNGLMISHCAASAASYTAADASESRLKAVKRKEAAANVFYIHAHADALPFADHTFDAVLLNHVLTFAPNDDAVLLEAGRLLKRNGILITLDYTKGEADLSETARLKLMDPVMILSSVLKEKDALRHLLLQNGWIPCEESVLDGTLPLVYMEWKKH